MSALKSGYVSGKKVEFMNEVLISSALLGYENYSYQTAEVVVFDTCPYRRHMKPGQTDPFTMARIFNEKYEPAAKVIAQQRPCVYMALHPHSYPSPFNRMRFCTALVEDKMVNGDDADVIIPAGALTYPAPEDMGRPCLLTTFGSLKHSAEFSDIRRRIAQQVAHDNSSDTCIGRGSGMDYVRNIQRSKFCATLPGDTRGGEKLAIAIMNGCVPVVKHHSWRYLPFRQYLNYSKFAVRLNPDMDVHSLLSVLRTVNYTELSSSLSQAQKWFDYTRQGTISPHALVWSEVADRWDDRR